MANAMNVTVLPDSPGGTARTGSGDQQGDRVENVPFHRATVFAASTCTDNDLHWYPREDSNLWPTV